VHGLKESNANVMYRGMKIGKVSGMQLAKDGTSVAVTVHIDESATQFLKAGTQFWLRGAEPNLSDPSSLGAVLSGPSIVMEPGSGQETTQFVGLTHPPIVSDARGQPKIYGASLAGTVGKLKKGSLVTLRGFTVGEVQEIGFRYDAESGQITTPVKLALYPSLFHLDNSGSADVSAGLASAIDHLVQHGLRARLERDPPLIGTPQVQLDMMPDTPAGQVTAENGVPQIPAAPGGGVNSIIDRINKLPIDQIAQNVLDATHHVDALVSSPQLDDAVAQIDATVQQLHQTTESAGPNIAKLVDGLRRATTQLDNAIKTVESTAKTAQNTAQAADKMLGGTPNQTGMQTAMHEITEAARSVRDLVNFLDRHPEALIQGRSGE
jgi:paraquat-inducible protein B